MKFLQQLFGKAPDPPPSPNIPIMNPKYHCIRFMTERGEQIGMLLTQDEFEVAVNRWVQNVSQMPISEEIDEEGTI